MLKQPSRETAADQVASVLFEAIMDGTIKSGMPLRLQEIADQIGMSMMPVREALRQLEAVGLVEIIPHKGAWVRPLTLDDLIDTYFSRMHLESVALREAAAQFTPADADRARRALADQQAALERDDQVAARNAHERFHFALYEACRSTWLARSIMPSWRNSERYRVESFRHPEHVAARAREHSLLLAALEEKDAVGAVTLLASHLRSSVELVAAGLAGESTTRLRLPELAELLPGTASDDRHPGGEGTVVSAE